MTGVKILDFKSMRKNALVGFTKIELASGIVIVDVSILISERGAWASPPSKPMVNAQGLFLHDDGSKNRYSPTIEFTSKDVRQRFSDAVIEALRASHPEALQ